MQEAQQLDMEGHDGCTLTHVVEFEELLELTTRTGASLGTSPSAPADYERFSKLVRAGAYFIPLNDCQRACGWHVDIPYIPNLHVDPMIINQHQSPRYPGGQVPRAAVLARPPPGATHATTISCITNHNPHHARCGAHRGPIPASSMPNDMAAVQH